VSDLATALASAHEVIADRLALLALSPEEERRALLEDLGRQADATAHAEEHILFPAVRRVLGDGVLVDACTAEHREVHDRLEALAARSHGAGFAIALESLNNDVLNHLQDEMESIVPVLEEALDKPESDWLGRRFAAEVRAQLG
jgi:hypothetical protein